MDNITENLIHNKDKNNGNNVSKDDNIDLYSDKEDYEEDDEISDDKKSNKKK